MVDKVMTPDIIWVTPDEHMRSYGSHLGYYDWYEPPNGRVMYLRVTPDFMKDLSDMCELWETGLADEESQGRIYNYMLAIKHKQGE